MVEKLIRKIWYRGAGAMLYRLTPDGECRVILFRRANNPDKGKYSITGGRMDSEERYDYRATAKRETWEEAKIDIVIPEDCPVLVTNLLFFKWKTYFVRYEGKIERSRFRVNEIDDWKEMSIAEALKRKDLARLMPRTLRALKKKVGKGLV